MNKRRIRSTAALWALAAASIAMIAASSAAAHGFAGKRFFPATLATDDPFVADELSLPTIASQKMPGERGCSGDARDRTLPSMCRSG